MNTSTVQTLVYLRRTGALRAEDAATIVERDFAPIAARIQDSRLERVVILADRIAGAVAAAVRMLRRDGAGRF